MRLRALLKSAAAALAVIGTATAAGMQPLPERLAFDEPVLTDRHGAALARPRHSNWNVTRQIPLWRIPPFLVAALLAAEDRRYYQHGGIDWLARGAALAANIRAGRVVRGGSTIPEQVVKMLHPRPRTVWTRWLEGIEAVMLCRRFSKADILEFYLNQVPYAGTRRGVSQAAEEYFGRGLSSLTKKEMLALVVMIRAPSRLDLRKDPWATDRLLARLAGRLHVRGDLTAEEHEQMSKEPLRLAARDRREGAEHFAEHVRRQCSELHACRGAFATSIDGGLQRKLQRLLDERVRALAGLDVSDGALLVVDHMRDEVLSWVNAGRFFADQEGSQVDAVLALRQPGSALKPFVYAAALERGWHAATLIDDSPYLKAVGNGIHQYHNYSRIHYGPVRLREALGNSLNVPAVRTADFIGELALLAKLRELGFEHLRESAEHYGEGLALGNGEVSLFELVRAYAVLARGGVWRELRLVPADHAGFEGDRLFSAEVSSIVADILADPQARALEFGHGSVLELPVPTAVKTGTSSAYRDAWALGFDSRYTVGVWMGNLNGAPMREVSGSLGPALVLRGAFAELQHRGENRALMRSPRLVKQAICRISGEMPTRGCPQIEEWFDPQHQPAKRCSGNHADTVSPAGQAAVADVAQIVSPADGLHLAMDPRIDDELEAFTFEVMAPAGARRFDWELNGMRIAQTSRPTLKWRLLRGAHTLRARIYADREIGQTPSVHFIVK